MNFRRQFLKDKLSRLLDRFAQPRSIQSDQARDDELAALARAIDRAAPPAGYEDWWPRFEDILVPSMKTRAWPTVQEISDAAGRVTAKGGAPRECEGDRSKLSFEALEALDTKVIPTAKRWVQASPGLAEHGAKTLTYWGEPIPEPNALPKWSRYSNQDLTAKGGRE